MKRVLLAAPIALVVVIVVLVLARLAVRSDLMPNDSVMLWASAIAAGDGEVPIGRILAGYPTIPFLTTTLFELAAPAGTPTPTLLAAILLGLMAGHWLLAFRGSGLGWLTAAAVTLLLALHPALLRTAIDGPAAMFFVLFLFLFARGLYDLRARSTTPEVMTVGLSLLGLAFSHPMGAAVACAATPLLVFAVRPSLVARSALNFMLVMVFPTVFCVGAFAYLAWVFPGSGWSFLTAPAQSLAAWAVGVARVFGSGFAGSLALTAAFATGIGLVVGAPLAPVMLGRVYRRRPLIAPAAVLVGSTVLAAVISVTTQLFGDPAVVLAAAPVLAAVVILRVPIARDHRGPLLALLVAGWFGGAVGLALGDPRMAEQLGAVFAGLHADHERTDTLRLGAATIGKDGILIDTYNAPAVVLARGSARGLLPPSDEAFALALMFGHIETPYVAVPDPQSPIGAQDRLNKTFPLLFRKGAPGYRLIYQNPSWRLFAKIGRKGSLPARQARSE